MLKDAKVIVDNATKTIKNLTKENKVLKEEIKELAGSLDAYVARAYKDPHFGDLKERALTLLENAYKTTK